MRNTIRLAFALALPTAAWACGEDRIVPATPAAPTPVDIFATPPVVLNGSTMLGTVSEQGAQGGRPIAGAYVNAWVARGPKEISYSYWWANGRVTTDGEGAFQLRNLPDGATVTIEAWKERYVQQCAAPPVVIAGTLPQLEIQLVPRNRVSASPSSLPAPAPGTRFVSGAIYQSGASGKVPAADVYVAHESSMDFAAAVT